VDAVTWRAARTSDTAGLADLFRAIANRSPIGLETEPAEIASRLSRPSLDLERDTLVGVDASGAVVAYAEAADMGVGQGQLRIRLTNAIHPDLGESTLHRTHDWLIKRARQLRDERRPDLPGVLGARCATADHTRLSLLTESGFEVVGWHQDLVRPVSEPLPPAPTERDVAVTPYHPAYDEAARVAHNDAYADNPSALLPDAQAWPQHAVGLPNFLPHASFLALADAAEGQEIAGFLFSLEQRDSVGAREAVLHCLGTRKQWRRRGVATTMIGHAFASYQRSGLARARLEVNSGNTAAVSLYTALGFTDSGRGYAMLHAPIR
jgi:mycothiol synthase